MGGEAQRPNRETEKQRSVEEVKSVVGVTARPTRVSALIASQAH